jgi:toxin ParE1/3/4
MRVRYSPRALRDLSDIAGYILLRSPPGARAVEARIKATIALIAEYPGCGRVVVQRPDVCVLPIGRYPYLIFYTIADDDAVILHIRHAAREPMQPGDI